MQPAAPTSSLPDRRAFLWSLASLGATGKARASHSQKDSEAVYRFTTPECEVQMSVEYFAASEIHSLRFRDSLSRQAFCLSANGTEDRSCLQPFSGALAIVHYRFRSRRHSHAPASIRERVLTIDHDTALEPRPPFEKLLVVDSGAVSDIQAFGYNPQNPDPPAVGGKPRPLWCLLRQDLYFNQQSSAFLIVHWKHAFNGITLLDVIPGERTELVSV
jgi:hypothetical protein